MDSTRRPDNTAPHSPSPPSHVSKSTNISQSGTRRATGVSTPQGRQSHTTTSRKALSNERFEGAAGASPSATSVPSQPSWRRDRRPPDNEPIAIPSEASAGLRTTTERRNTSQFNVEPDVQSRASQNIAAYSIPSSGIYASKDARAAQREDVTNPGPSLSANPMQATSQPHPVTTSPQSRNVMPSRKLQETGSNTPLRPLGPEEWGVRNESSYPQVDTRKERTVIRTHSGEGDRTVPVLLSAKPPTTYPPPPTTKPSTAYPPPSAKPSAPPPPPFNRPSASTSLLSSSTGTPHLIPPPNASAPALAKATSSQMNMPRGALPSDLQAQTRGATFESPHPPSASADRGLARPWADEQGRKDPSATSHRQPATREYIPATTEPPRQGYKDAIAVPHMAPIRTEHNLTATERPSRLDRKDHSAAASYRPPAPTTGYGPDVTQYQRAPTESSIHPTDSSYRGYGYDSGASRLPDTSNSRKKTGQPLNTAPPLDRRETHITPPTPFQSQPQLIRETSISHSNSTSSCANAWSQLPVDSRTHLTSDKYASSNLDRGHGSQLQVGRNFPESQHPTEHPATAGTSFPEHSRQQWRGLHQAHSSQSFLHPLAGVDSQGRSSISSRTSSEGRDGPVAGQPTPVNFSHPLANESGRYEQHRERASSSGQGEDEPPPPGLRGNGNDTQSPDMRGGCLCFH